MVLQEPRPFKLSFSHGRADPWKISHSLPVLPIIRNLDGLSGFVLHVHHSVPELLSLLGRMLYSQASEFLTLTWESWPPGEWRSAAAWASQGLC